MECSILASFKFILLAKRAALLKSAPITFKGYSFKYSPRPGTPASLDKNLIDELVLNKRLKKIQKVLLDQQNYFNNTFLEKEVEVLFTKKTNKTDQFVGRTKYLQPVHVFSKVNLIGKILRIKIEKLTSFSFHGRIISS